MPRKPKVPLVIRSPEEQAAIAAGRRKLAEIVASPSAPVYVNLHDPGLRGDGMRFYAAFKWDGVRLWKPVHSLDYSRKGWSRAIDVSLTEMTSWNWVVVQSGHVPLSAGEFQSW